MAEAFWPRRHLRGEAFTEPTLVTFPKTPELEKLGAWESVTDALYKAAFRPIRDGFVLPVLPQKIPTNVFFVEKFKSKVLVKRELQFGYLQMYSGPKGLVHEHLCSAPASVHA